MVALEVWCSHPDHRHALQNCLLEAFAEPATISSRHCGAVLAQLLGSTMPSTADGLEEILHTARANLDSPSDAEAILAALQVLEVAYQRWFLKDAALKNAAVKGAALEDAALEEEALEDQLLALLGRGGAPAHAAAWALAWLGVDPVPATASPPPFSHNRLWPPLSSQHSGLATTTGWRPSRQATAGLVRALRQAQLHEIDLKRHLVGLLGLASHADVLPPLLARLDEPDASVRRAVQIALASLAQWVLPLSASCLSELEAELTHRLLRNATLAEPERAEALVLLALFDREELLRQLLSDPNAPVLLRRCALECLGLLASRRGGGEHRRRIEAFLEEQLRADALDLLVEGKEGWAEHDARLPLLQGASRAMQLAASAELPLLGSGPGRAVPMLTLTALQEGEALRIRTEVVRPAVWRLPLPEWPGEAPQQLELVVVEGGEYTIGSPEQEAGRDDSPQYFGDECEGVDLEAQRTVRPQRFALARHPLTQAQWQAVARLPRLQRDLNPSPSHFEPGGLWERFAQPGGLPVDSVSWNDCQEWLGRLNRWLVEQWSDLGGQGAAPQLALPGEGQWEVACRAGGTKPFHFGDTLDTSWANYDGGFRYGAGREGIYRQRLVSVGAFGLVNRWGLAEMHGQLWEWCGDQWHRDPVAASAGDGSPWECPDLELDGNQEQEPRRLRGGSWFYFPRYCRSAERDLYQPDYAGSHVGFRVVCLPQDASLNP
jgi:formylglycine-generating enzyme required for sulfatase activity